MQLFSVSLISQYQKRLRVFKKRKHGETTKGFFLSLRLLVDVLLGRLGALHALCTRMYTVSTSQGTKVAVGAF